jgi:VanZ family protein
LNPAGALRRRLGDALLVVALACVAVLTLTPTPGSEAGPRFAVLGSLADLLRNLALFVPAGAALALRGAPARLAWRGGLALAIGIELAQLAIPGRATSPDDALANALGAGLGHAWVTSAPRWLRPAPAAARRLELAACAVFAAAVVLTGVLTQPALPPLPWHAHWNPSVGSLVPYAGPVRGAALAGQPLPHGALLDPAAAREALLAGRPLRVRVTASGAASGFQAIFLVTDAKEEEVALLGLSGDDLVYRSRSRARAVSLESSVLRAAGLGLREAAAPTVLLSVERDGLTRCLAQGERRVCGLGFRAGSGWTLLLPVLALPARLDPLLDLAWLALLALPVGLWWRLDWASLLATAAATAALVGVPLLGWLAPTPLEQALAAAAGFGLGAGLARLSDGGRPPRGPAGRTPAGRTSPARGSP